MDEPSPLTAWPGLRAHSRLPGGNRLTMLQGEYDGMTVVVRRSTRDAAALDWELDVLAHLVDVGVRVPEIIRSVDGRRHVDGWHVYRHIEGRAATESDSDELRHAVRQVHEATTNWPQRRGFWDARALLSADRGGDVDLHALPTELVVRIRAAWAAVQPKPTSVIHGDLSAGNAIIGPGGEVTLIDWDESRVDDPGFDTGTTPAWGFAQLAWEIATCWTREPEYAASLVDDFLRRSP